MERNGLRGIICRDRVIKDMAIIQCVQCNQAYPDAGVPYCCPACGGVFDYDCAPEFHPSMVDPAQPGLWRYRHAFGLPDHAPVPYLGEGLTPLVPVRVREKQVLFKLESQNPTGSYKDRGSTVLVSQLLHRGVGLAVEDSSGNAGASFAAYCARGGLKARVYVPESASGPKRIQIERYGADLVRVPGPRAEAARAVLRDAKAGIPYASHAYLPFGLAGIATISYEIFEQIGTCPGSVIAPVGHGGLLLGVMRGFQSLQGAGLITDLPYFVGVQAANCAPLVEASRVGMGALDTTLEGNTIAEGVKVRRPMRGEALLNEMKKGEWIAIPEEEILLGFQALAAMGIYIEPTSALGWAALVKLIDKLPEPIVVVLTGSGLKYEGGF